jgi:hypothetical protein
VAIDINAINAAVADEKRRQRRRFEAEGLRVTRCLTHAIERAAHGVGDRTSLLELRQFTARGD